MITHQKGTVWQHGAVSKSMAMLGNSEDNAALSCVLSQLAELDTHVEQLQQDQAY
uniref:Sorting nexin/Vps5-like C-terminal domain-containing protein n=1 Tax=Anguilla anguilla TaxID=7936 RepID=A0A0E9RAF9_ANGAN